MKYQIILYYKYVLIDNPQKLRDEQFDFCETHNLKGRIIVATEGINGTLEGTYENVKKYVDYMLKNPQFKDMNFKYSDGNGDSFPKLSVKVKDEIVTTRLGEDDINPNELTGKYITAEELHNLFESQQEFYIIDMRNDYEHKVGHFKNSILPNLHHFRDLPKILPDIEHLKNKKIVTVCTGGVRCEKASGYLMSKGFNDVSQLQNGIVTYMEKYPNENFLGELYVFDQRVIMGFNLDSPEHVVIGKCELCGKTDNTYINCANDECHIHFICCENCQDTNKKVYCKNCLENNK